MIVFLFTIAVKLALDTLKVRMPDTVINDFFVIVWRAQELIVDALDPSLMPIVNQIFEEFTMVGMVRTEMHGCDDLDRQSRRYFSTNPAGVPHLIHDHEPIWLA